MIEFRYFMLATSFLAAALLYTLLNVHPAVVSLRDTNPSSRFDQFFGCGRYVGECDLGRWCKRCLNVGEKKGTGCGQHISFV